MEERSKMKMKSRREFPPGGWAYTEPRVPGWSAPSHSSFDVVVNAIIALRKGNRWLITEHKLSTDLDTVSNEVDEYNAKRMVSMGYDHFVQDANVGVLQAAPFQRPQHPSLHRAVATSAVKRVTAGVGTLKEWWGDGLKSVDGHIAENRASICETCPLNRDPNWIEKLIAAAAEKAKQFLEVKRALQLRTRFDDKLHFCDGCGCGIETKIWVPINVIRKTMIPEIKQALDPRCWQLHEKDEPEVKAA